MITHRPGMLPPTLNGRSYDVQVLPLSEEARIAPLLGSHLYRKEVSFPRELSEGKRRRTS